MKKGRVASTLTNCERCERSFDKENPLHAKNMCRNCYNYTWIKARNGIEDRGLKSTTPNCSVCFTEFGQPGFKDKIAYRASKGMCRQCYNRTQSRICSSCGKSKGKKSIGPCSLCRINRDTESSSRFVRRKTKVPEGLPTEVLQQIKMVLLRYKHNMYTGVDHFIVADLYIKVFNSGEVGYKNPIGMDIDRFDEMSQVTAMLKLLKMTYDKNK